MESFLWVKWLCSRHEQLFSHERLEAARLQALCYYRMTRHVFPFENCQLPNLFMRVCIYNLCFKLLSVERQNSRRKINWMRKKAAVDSFEIFTCRKQRKLRRNLVKMAGLQAEICSRLVSVTERKYNMNFRWMFSATLEYFSETRAVLTYLDCESFPHFLFTGDEARER